MIKNHILYTDYSDWLFTISKAEGSYLWDNHGNKYIDFTSGWNVTNLGWNNPEIKEAVTKQLEKNVYAPMWTADPMQESYAEALLASLPQPLDTIIRATGGTEANEEAIKIARAATGRKKIIGFADTYHGQSFGDMAIGFRPEYVKSIAPLVPEFIQLEYPNTTQTSNEHQLLQKFLTVLEEKLAQKDVAAIITEAGIVTGWGSVFVAPKHYLTEVRKLTKRYGTLLILDEVGTGFSRIGTLFGMEKENVTPDIVTFAKGMSNGAAAIGACITSSKIVEPTIPDTNLTSTFGWTPLACSAALKTLEIHKRDEIFKKAHTDGTYLLATLQKKLLSNPRIVAIRGEGMEIGIEFVKKEKYMTNVIKKAFANGLHLTHDTESIIQLMPPLTIEKADIDRGIDILLQSID